MSVDLSFSAFERLEADPGYEIGRITEAELQQLRQLIKAQYLARITAMEDESTVQLFKSSPMQEYHLLADRVDHKALWPKAERILSNSAVQLVKQMPFFQQLRQRYGVTAVTAEEGVSEAEFYWRIVRPGDSDIGDLHADKWFWDCNPFANYRGMERIKIWLAIESIPHKNGLRVLPGSHIQEHWQYQYEQDANGKSRPKFDESQAAGLTLDLPLTPGEFVVFHDKLIHGGMANKSQQTRISLEATLLIPAA